MCKAKKENTLFLIENGIHKVILLDDRAQWSLGRPSTGNCPDIKIQLPTVSRRHGRLVNIDGYWFFYNDSGERKTAINGKYIRKGYGGMKRPTMLKDMDCMVFGSDVDDLESENNTVAFYFNRSFDGGWKVIDMKGIDQFTVLCDGIKNRFSKPQDGVLVDSMSGRVLYLGDYAYVTGEATLMEA